jgi:23S rRNA (guanosine2251-2'-O)-methyltransferase
MRKLQLEELGRISPEEFRKKEKTQIILVLDNIRSGLNVGSAFRTADAFALQGLYLCGITAQPPHREILKTAIGATESVDWKYFESVTEAAALLKEQGYRIMGIEQTDESEPIQEVVIDPEEKYAIILGNEVRGISEEVLEMLDKAVEVPQYGTKHSLNVSVCTGIVVWHFFSKMNF